MLGDFKVLLIPKFCITLLMFLETSVFSLLLFPKFTKKMQHNFYVKIFINPKSEVENINSYTGSIKKC